MWDVHPHAPSLFPPAIVNLVCDRHHKGCIKLTSSHCALQYLAHSLVLLQESSIPCLSAFSLTIPPPSQVFFPPLFASKPTSVDAILGLLIFVLRVAQEEWLTKPTLLLVDDRSPFLPRGHFQLRDAVRAFSIYYGGPYRIGLTIHTNNYLVPGI